MSFWRSLFGFSDNENQHETYDEAVKRATRLLAIHDYEGAFRVLRHAERQQHAEGIYWLACCYWNGTGVREDASRAMHLWEKASALGYEPAQQKAEEMRKLMG